MTMDIFSDLPSDALYHVLTFLDAETFMGFGSTSKQALSFIKARENVLWRGFCKYQYDVQFKPSLWNWKKVFFSMAPPPESFLCHHLNSTDISFLQEKIKKIPMMCQDATCSHKSFEYAWACATKGCNYVGCSRSTAGHAIKHHNQTNHPISQRVGQASSAFLSKVYDSPWCYVCDRFLGSSHAHSSQLKNKGIAYEYQYVTEMMTAMTNPAYFVVKEDEEKLKWN